MEISAQQLQKLLLTWFDQHGRKTLPWQQNKTPYSVWVSEIMLQQTQVGTVIPYFERFMQQFPDLFALANAAEDAVLHLWAGLGYYSRARCLHKAAKLLVQEYNAEFPADLTELQKLPGVGRSTAAAILSIAFNQRAAILDGNVKRVLARLAGIEIPLAEKKAQEKLWELAEIYAPEKRAADYTQAMMDLGATLCMRSKPRCIDCPLQQHCVAYQQNTMDILPIKKITKQIPTRDATFFVIQYGTHILLKKRASMGIWGGLWCLPESVGQLDEAAVKSFCHQEFGLVVKEYQTLKSFKHTFTHYHLNIFPVRITLKKAPLKLMEAGKQIWYNLTQPEAIGLPKPIQSLLRSL